MTKMNAIFQLVSGEADMIQIGKTVYILNDKKSVVNKRSGKVIDANNMAEDGWEVILEPKWYDSLPERKGILCWVKSGEMSLIEDIINDNMLVNALGEEIGNKDEVWPVEPDEIGEYLLNSKPVKKSRRKQIKQENDRKSEDSAIIPEQNLLEDEKQANQTEGNEVVSPSENSESTVLQKEDAQSSIPEDSDGVEILKDEIPF